MHEYRDLGSLSHTPLHMVRMALSKMSMQFLESVAPQATNDTMVGQVFQHGSIAWKIDPVSMKQQCLQFWPEHLGHDVKTQGGSGKCCRGCHDRCSRVHSVSSRHCHCWVHVLAAITLNMNIKAIACSKNLKTILTLWCTMMGHGSRWNMRCTILSEAMSRCQMASHVWQ